MILNDEKIASIFPDIEGDIRQFPKVSGERDWFSICNRIRYEFVHDNLSYPAISSKLLYWQLLRFCNIFTHSVMLHDISSFLEQEEIWNEADISSMGKGKLARGLILGYHFICQNYGDIRRTMLEIMGHNAYMDSTQLITDKFVQIINKEELPEDYKKILTLSIYSLDQRLRDNTMSFSVFLDLIARS